MTLEDRIKVLAALGTYMQSSDESLHHAKILAKAHNGWFDVQSVDTALIQMSQAYLDIDVLRSVASAYEVPDTCLARQVVGLVLAGNIPLVGLHDIVCVFLSGHYAKVKYSSKDYLLKHLIEYMCQLDEGVLAHIEEIDRLKDIQAVIATGSNNTAGYFDTYFGKYPNIIRRNRSAVAVLHGDEGESDFKALAQDIFTYYGLGCRNVSHIVLPSRYDFKALLDCLHDNYKQVVLNNKYKNNYDFQYATMLMNKVDFKMTGSLLLREAEAVASPLAVVHYSYYDDEAQLVEWLESQRDAIQCVVSNSAIGDLPIHPLGHAQGPAFTDYADNVDTMAFLVNLCRATLF
jgi:hypothetical protein